MNNFWGRAWARTVATALLTVACAAAVHAAPLYAYMSAADEPFFDYSNQAAMTAAFGVQDTDWSRLQFGDAFSSYKMLYIDGGGSTAADMVTFVNDHRGALETFVLGGGRLFINAATNEIGPDPISLLFGATLNEQADNNRGLTGFAVDGSSQLFANAGTSWDGFFFSHDDIGLAAGYSSLIVDDKGRTVLAGGAFGNGYVMLGGQTNAAEPFQYETATSNPFQLRVNELRYVDQFSTTAPIPEPGSLALVLLAGLALTHTLRARRA